MPNGQADSGRQPKQQDRPLLVPPEIFPSCDLTFLASRGDLSRAVADANAGSSGWPIVLDNMARGLFRRQARHVLLTGQRGVGKTTAVRELARQVSSGQFDFLQNARFILGECQNVLRHESRPRFAALFEWLAGQQNVVVCLDGLGALLRGEHGATNISLLRAALRLRDVRIIGVLSQWDYDDLLASDAEILDVCTRVEMPEPDEAATLPIVRQVAAQIEADFDCRIPVPVQTRAVELSARFIWSQCFPIKAIRVLERACENLAYERRQNGETRAELVIDDVIRVVSEISRVPAETLSGDIDGTDYEQILGSAVVGQSDAVAAVARELRLIRAGITDPGKPASVMLFCGLNGVGKTELAKRLAEIYSTSKRLQIYTMGNFVESHSVSGIIGVPAGYVGHDQGGQLVNDLNADPYGVFLLDEIEKSHPDVLKPFLNLFDEGWIVDQRGVKAYADRAIFILTSNAGYEAISQMHQDRRPMHEIIEHVKNSLSRVRNERSSQPVLSQAFLARIKRIQIFNPLDEPAMLGIARILIDNVQKTWLKHRGKQVQISEPLISHIARQGHEINTKSNGREGGRGIRRLISELIEDQIQQAAIRARSVYQRATIIQLNLRDREIDSATPPISNGVENVADIAIDVRFS